MTSTKLDLADQLDLLSAWMQTENLDMQCPEGVQDPSVLATAHRALIAEHKATKERMDRAEFLLAIMTATSRNFFFTMHQSTLSLCTNADIAWDRALAAEASQRAAEAELSATKEELAAVVSAAPMALKKSRRQFVVSMQCSELAALHRAVTAEAQLARAKEGLERLASLKPGDVVNATSQALAIHVRRVARSILQALEQG